MSNRIHQLICDINAAWKPDHFVYAARDQEFRETHSVPQVLERWMVADNKSEPTYAFGAQGDPSGHPEPSGYEWRLDLRHTKLILGANSRLAFRIVLETNACSTVRRGMAWGFFARIVHFEMSSRTHRYLPLVSHIPDDKSGAVEAMEKFLSELLEELTSPTAEVAS